MVCDRCIMTVRDILEDCGYDVKSVELGQAEIDEEPESNELEVFADKLRNKGFELIRDEKDVLVEEIKTTLIEFIDYLEEQEDPRKASEYLSQHLHHNYSYLSSHFSKETNFTIEQYLIQLKIERVKELLSYQELTLSEIAWKLNYSSVQYLSNQFKKVTGETVSSFRKHLHAADRKSLDAFE